MDKAKRKKLAAKGWKVGTVEEFLELTPEEATYVEMKVVLSESLRAQRMKAQISQVELARRIRSSQSRVAKIESGDPGVSIDLIVKSLLALGFSRRDLAKTIASTSGRTA